MKKIFSILSIILLITSCEDITELNEATKLTTKVEGQTLFANATKNLSDILATPNVNSNIFRLIVQHWTETTYVDESNYNLATRQIPQNFWNALYRDVLRDLKEARTTIEAIDPLYITDEDRANQLAMIEVLETCGWFILVTTYGDIPYTDALDFNVLNPTYDDAATIYGELFTKIDHALENLNPEFNGFGNYDLIYGGDVAQWIKFANAIKLKMAMTIADVNPETAQPAAEAAVLNTFMSNDDNANFEYLVSPPNTNPIWVNLVQSGRKDFVAANTLLDTMVATDDPRVPFYFALSGRDGIYKGGVPGDRNSASSNSQPADEIIKESFEGLFMDYVEVEFYKAEMVERGWDAGGGSAEEHFNTAVMSSMLYWGVDEGAATAYVNSIDYAANPATWQEKIGVQKWIALYNRGVEAWLEWRRLDYPVLPLPTLALSDTPVRYTYPVDEQNLNTINYDAATAKLGGDDVSIKLWWDKF